MFYYVCLNKWYQEECSTGLKRWWIQVHQAVKVVATAAYEIIIYACGVRDGKGMGLVEGGGRQSPSEK